MQRSLSEAVRIKKILEITDNHPLAPLTTFKIGGRARYFAKALTEADVVEAVTFARENGLDLFILGGGSNLLVSDSGFDGLVLQIAISGITLEGSDNVVAAAGEDWDGFVAFCVQNNLAGVECLSGIPGFVGGTPVQNVGAYGQEVSGSIVSVRCLDRESLEIAELSNADCGFSYRTSIFNTTHRDRFIVLSVNFRLIPDSKGNVVYKDLKEHFGDQHPTVGEVRDAVLKIRRSKSMVIDENDSNTLCAGSFFKNPIVEQSVLGSIKEEFPDVPSFPFGDKVKIPAAWLIERSGFAKGFERGRAGISTNHTLALINRGEASAADIIALKDEIQAEVARRFGIDLHPEPVFLGF